MPNINCSQTFNWGITYAYAEYKWLKAICHSKDFRSHPASATVVAAGVAPSLLNLSKTSQFSFSSSSAKARDNMLNKLSRDHD